MSNKLDIKSEMAAFDRKDRKFYANLTDEERKKFSTYLMIRWGSSVRASPELEGYYVLSANERLNKHFFDISKMPELQWLCATTVSPGIGNQYHVWIAPKKKAAGENNKIRKFIEKHYPHLKADEIKLLEQLNDPGHFRDMAVKLGYDDRQIREELG